MKQEIDKFTRDALETPKKGRLSKFDAKTSAQRSKLYRTRQKMKKFDFLESQNSINKQLAFFFK
jgi:hypothetical protein